jgi:NADH-quinone oxidoreductase subunit M
MTIFIGSFQEQDMFHRVLTLIATTSIVVTAVYILRTVGKFLYGELVNPEHANLTDATWYERVSVVVLILFIVAIGVLPSFSSDIISDSIAPVIAGLR